MQNIVIVGSTLTSQDNKQILVGWDNKTKKVYVSYDAVEIKWMDIDETAQTEDLAKVIGKNYINKNWDNQENN